MKSYETLNEFIDGSLDSAGEEDFFRELASDHELQFRMKQIMAMKASIQNNISSLLPTPETTNKVFSALGFSPAGVVPIKLTLGQRTADIYRKYSQGIKSGVVFSLAAAAIVFILMREKDSGFKPVGDTGSYISSTMTAGEKNQVIPKITSVDKELSPIVQTRTIVKYVYVPVNAPDSENQPGNYETAGITRSDFPNSQLYRDDLNDITDPVTGFSPGMNPPSAELLLIPFADDGSNLLSVGIEGAQYWLTPEATIMPSKIARFTNNGVNAFLKLSDAFSIGGEVRQENFFQRYTGISDMGVNNTYEQQPNFTTYSLALRYYYTGLGLVEPLAQVTAGGNKAGFVGRLMTGVEYSPYRNISFLLGVEYSALSYHHQGNKFVSGKLGINYGINYKF